MSMRSYCKVCCRNLPRAQFSGEGLASHVCRKCQRLSPAEQSRRQALDELAGFVRQKNLSVQNRRRLAVLAKSANEVVSQQARVLLEVAKAHPHLSKRLPYLREKQPALYSAYLEAFGDTVADETDVTAVTGAPMTAASEASVAVDNEMTDGGPPRPLTEHDETSVE